MSGPDCTGIRHRLDGSTYSCPGKVLTPGKVLCSRCEMASLDRALNPPEAP